MIAHALCIFNIAGIQTQKKTNTSRISPEATASKMGIFFYSSLLSYSLGKMLLIQEARMNYLNAFGEKTLLHDASF